jgi:hypothetical protein
VILKLGGTFTINPPYPLLEKVEQNHFWKKWSKNENKRDKYVCDLSAKCKGLFYIRLLNKLIDFAPLFPKVEKVDWIYYNNN